MANKADIRRKVLDQINERRLDAEQTAKLHGDEIRRKIPEIAELDTFMESIALRLFDGTRRDSMTVDQLGEQHKKIRKQKAALLQQHGFPTDYTQVKYTCEACGDTGFVGYKMCDCAKLAMQKEAVLSSGLGSLIEKQRFDTFRLNRFSIVATAGKISDRARMEKNVMLCREFAETFNRENPPMSLLMIGKTGLGKTHLSTAIASRVMERGFSNILSTMEKVQFGRAEEDAQQAYFTADLLITDDLGTEYTGKFTASALFILVNTRLNHNLPMIINTNLDPMAMEKKYEQRIFSRFFGEFTVLPFVGSDARMGSS